MQHFRRLSPRLFLTLFTTIILHLLDIHIPHPYLQERWTRTNLPDLLLHRQISQSLQKLHTLIINNLPNNSLLLCRIRFVQCRCIPRCNGKGRRKYLIIGKFRGDDTTATTSITISNTLGRNGYQSSHAVWTGKGFSLQRGRRAALRYEVWTRGTQSPTPGIRLRLRWHSKVDTLPRTNVLNGPTPIHQRHRCVVDFECILQRIYVHALDSPC
mmetsp:Transcript_21683/g.47155  ORF Transcript_21683/g.47155 Transcript_21683/m.47155 type:complete len:213 (-) Transcript_21683:578-1216(-)